MLLSSGAIGLDEVVASAMVAMARNRLDAFHVLSVTNAARLYPMQTYIVVHGVSSAIGRRMPYMLLSSWTLRERSAATLSVGEAQSEVESTASRSALS